MSKITLSVILSLIVCVCVHAQGNGQNKQLQPSVDKMAFFPGYEEAMHKFIDERLFYPWAEDSVKGRVDFRFVVTKFGDIENIEVLRSLNPLADSIAVSIIREMPRWIPAMLNGVPVQYYYELSIEFDPTKIPADKKLSKNICMPSFPGGEAEMYKFFSENLRYPYQERTIQGRAVVQFIIDSKGKIWHPSVKRSLDPVMDAEVLRIVRMMPDWDTSDVNVGCYLYTLRLMFKVQ